MEVEFVGGGRCTVLPVRLVLKPCQPDGKDANSSRWQPPDLLTRADCHCEESSLPATQPKTKASQGGRVVWVAWGHILLRVLEGAVMHVQLWQLFPFPQLL